MFDIKLYNRTEFYKKRNSTKRPSTGYLYTVTLTGNLKLETSITDPVIEIAYENQIYAQFEIYDYNYAYIEKFHRYYFVDKWEYGIGVWNCYLTVDVLASFLNTMLLEQHDRILLRSSNISNYNTNIVDNMFPTTYQTFTQSFNSNTTIFTRNTNDGIYVIGTVHGAAVGDPTMGCCDYYIVDRDRLNVLIDELYPMQSADWVSETFSGDIINRAIYNPKQYLTSIKYFPIDKSNVSGMGNDRIYFGNYRTSVYGKRLPTNTNTWIQILQSIPLPAAWSNMTANQKSSEYANMVFRWYPFGTCNIDIEKLHDATSVTLVGLIDFISGLARLGINGTNNSGDTFIQEMCCNIGCDVSIDAIQQNLSNGISAIMGLTNIAVSPLAGAASALSGLADFSNTGIMKHDQIGSGGFPSVASVMLYPELIYSYKQFTTPDYESFGYPCCMLKTISSAGIGYQKWADGDFNGCGIMTAAENDQINQYLTDGYFLEV